MYLRPLSSILLLASLAAPALAQEPPKDWVPPEEDVQKKALDEAAAEEKKDGWFPKLSLGSNISFSHNSNVVGSEEGTTVNVGVLLDGGLELRSGPHEWGNTLALRYQETRTPLIDRFVKSMDQLEFQSIYFYHLPALPWVGPFGRFRLQTQILPSELVRAEVVDVVSTDGAEVLRAGLPARTGFDLAGAFEPLILRESLGAFVKPYDQKEIKLLVKLGAGAQEILTRGGYVIADESETAAIEVQPLEDSTEIGAEAEVEATGAVDDNLTWTVNANALYPFVTTTDVELEESPLNVEFLAKVGFKVTDWGAIEYVFSAKRVPLVVEEWQIQNGLLFSLTLNVL